MATVVRSSGAKGKERWLQTQSIVTLIPSRTMNLSHVVLNKNGNKLMCILNMIQPQKLPISIKTINMLSLKYTNFPLPAGANPYRNTTDNLSFSISIINSNT